MMVDVITMLSAWEMRTHGQAALRVVGVPFGGSERAMQMLVWSHAVQGGAVEFLIEHTDRLAPTVALNVVVESSTEITLDANGQSLLTAGPAAIDLAVAMAVSEGSGTVVVQGTFGYRFGAEMAWRGAANGTPTEVTTPEATWRATGRELLIANGHGSDLTIRCGPAVTHFGEPVDVANRLAAAERRGYRTETNAAARFLELGHRLWLPSSARSRAQGSEGDQA